MTKILIIEDTNDMRTDLVELLVLEGFDAVGAENGQVGVERALDFRPDLILCDIMMPEMDGYEVLKTLRSNPQTATIPFIFLTALSEKPDVRYGMVLGADDYLTKPFAVNEVLESIHSQLRKRAEFNARAEERLAALRENIMTALPHELRTPLNSILGFSEMMIYECQRLKPDQITDWAQHIYDAGQRLYRLVENYLYYMRIETSRSGNAPAAAALPISALSDTIEVRAIQTAEKHQRIENLKILFDGSGPGQYVVSEQDLAKIVEELVDNACKFSEPGTEIVVGTSTDSNSFTLTIADHGRGMTEDQIHSIGAYMQFERWFYEQQGMGLGLAIVKRLAEEYRAHFMVHSIPGESTKVSIAFPRAHKASQSA